MITEVRAGSPADKAGLKVGDTIGHVYVSKPPVDNIQTVKEITVKEIQNSINGSKGSPVTVEYIVNGGIKRTTISPVSGLVKDKYAIGIAMSDVVDLHLPILTAIYEGLHYTLVMIRETAIGLYSFIANIFQGTADFSQVSGPIGIAGIVGDAATLGFTYLMMITALISINLGVINLLPFPALDGGRILFVAIESIIRRRISHKFTNVVNAVGFALLMILMVLVTYKDIAKLWR
jgi:regulator of sigma E protease